MFIIKQKVNPTIYNLINRSRSVLHTNFKAKRMTEFKDELLSMFYKSVSAVDPKNLIKNNIKRHGNKLMVCGKEYSINKNCYIVGFGKAVFGMCAELEAILDGHLMSGIVSIPTGVLIKQRPASSSKVRYIEGAFNNLPDSNTEYAAREIKKLVEQLKKEDLLIALISGGGSALLPYPKYPISLEEKTALIKKLSLKGANISELNCVRKNLSMLKGGGLAKFAYPANVISLILSDIINDPLDYIASGPTVPNTSNSDKALNIIKKYNLENETPNSIKEVLNTNDANQTIVPFIPESGFEHVSNYILGNNKIALKSAMEEAKNLKYEAIFLSSRVSGDVNDISEAYSSIVFQIGHFMNGRIFKPELTNTLIKYQYILNYSNEEISLLSDLNFKSKKKICLILGGEPTVLVKGTGRGGRNQHLALQFAVDLNKKIKETIKIFDSIDVYFLSCGTDGIDGPTDAAGAICFKNLYSIAKANGIDPENYLINNDSYSFFDKFCNGEFLVKTGHTGTNVMDIHILVMNNEICKNKL